MRGGPPSIPAPAAVLASWRLLRAGRGIGAPGLGLLVQQPSYHVGRQRNTTGREPQDGEHQGNAPSLAVIAHEPRAHGPASILTQLLVADECRQYFSEVCRVRVHDGGDVSP